MGWASAIQAARLEKKIKELESQQTMRGYSSSDDFSHIRAQPAGFSGYLYVGRSGYKYDEDKNDKNSD